MGSEDTDASWPGVGSERPAWVPTAAWGATAGASPSQQWYTAAIPPRIASARLRGADCVATSAEAATRELARLDAELGSRVSSFAPVLLRSEAAASSQIENLTASARSIFSAELGAPAGGNAQQIAGNTRAMEAAIDLASSVTAESIREMHAVLMASVPRHRPGQWREEAVWIGRHSDSPVGADFVAPHHERIADLIEDLVEFVQRRDLPPLALVALSHAQFETIHPFTDGNGRTGRALAQSLLRATEVTRSVAVPVSAGLLADVDGYHRALTAYRAGDVVPIIDAFTHASLRAVRNVRELVEEIDRIRAQWNERLAARRDSHAWRLLDVLTRRPVLTSALAAEELGSRQTNVYPPLAALEKAGIVTSRNVHRMGPFWRSDEVLDAIDRFAERAGRRQRTD